MENGKTRRKENKEIRDGKIRRMANSRQVR